jgi:hypothetical protein
MDPEFYSGNLKEGDHLGDLGKDEKLQKWLLKKYVGIM